MTRVVRKTHYSKGWMRTKYLLWSTYQTVTGSVELSIQLFRLCANGSGSTYSIHRSVRGLNLTHRPLRAARPFWVGPAILIQGAPGHGPLETKRYSEENLRNRQAKVQQGGTLCLVGLEEY